MTDPETNESAEQLWQAVPYHIRMSLLAWSMEQAYKHQIRYSEECYLQEAFRCDSSGINNIGTGRAFSDECSDSARAEGQRNFTLSSGYLALAAFLDAHVDSLIVEED